MTEFQRQTEAEVQDVFNKIFNYKNTCPDIEPDDFDAFDEDEADPEV